MKIAFATTDQKNIDEHFGRAGTFVIYDLAKDGWRLAEVRKFADGVDREIVSTRGRGEVHEDRVQAKVDRLADCKVIFLTEIGGPSAARLVRKGIMPVKVKAVTPIEQELEKLMQTLRTSPPPWLKKTLNAE
jgi:nitrogen fixation protein NifX